MGRDGPAPRRHIVMLGTAPLTMGGIAAVVQAYQAGGLFGRWPLRYLATHGDGGVRVKLARLAHSALQLLGLLLRGRVALLHVHLASRASFWRKLLLCAPAWLARVPVMVHLHGGGFQDFYAGRGAVGRWLIRLMFRRAALVLVLSARWRAWLLSVCPQARVEVLPNPVALPPPQPYGAGGPVVFLGKLCAAKGCYDLLEAAARLLPDHPGLQLVLAGEGERAALRARADALGLGGAVVLPGWLDAGAKAALLARAAVYALPSYYEGLPVSLLEAMAAGLPVVASRAGGIPDLVGDGVQGYLVPAGDVAALAARLAQLLAAPAQAAALGAAGRALVAQAYASAVVLPRLEGWYRELSGVDTRPEN